MNELFERIELRVAVALVIGLVIGAEREQRISESSQTAHRIAGLRTFALVALLGAVSMLLGSPWIAAISALGVIAAALVAYGLGDRTDPGLTSEIALVLTFALGALATLRPELALAIGIVTALLLAFRARLHEAVRVTLTPSELRDALLVAAAALVALPLLPDRSVDPWHVLNPFVLWRLVVVVLVVHLGAHVARRAVGARWGLLIAGLASGFVSSVATIAAFGKRDARAPGRARAALAGATASTIATFVQMGVLVTAASPTLGAHLAIPLAAGGSVALAIALVIAFGVAREAVPEEDEKARRAVDIRGALAFASLVGIVTLASAGIREIAGDQGVIVGAALAALVDTHAAAASVASVEASGALPTSFAAIGVLACLSANSLTKCVVAFASGGREYGARVSVATCVVLAAAWIGWALAS